MCVMAASHQEYLNFTELNEITSCTNCLQAYLRQHKLLFNLSGPCGRCCSGKIQLRQDTPYRIDGQVWRCTNRKCAAKISVRKYSFFSQSHLSLAKITHLIYYWMYKYSQEIVLHESRLSSNTVVDFYNFCREVCCVVIEENSEPIGGQGKIVEVDKSKFGKRKFHKGKRIDGVWKFGGIERNSTPPVFFRHCTRQIGCNIDSADKTLDSTRNYSFI